MEESWNERLSTIEDSLPFFIPESLLILSFLVLIVLGLIKCRPVFLMTVALAGFAGSIGCLLASGLNLNVRIFNGILAIDGVSTYLKILLDLSGVLTCILFTGLQKKHASEYFALITAAVTGGHLLVMSNNFLMAFLALELISIASYVLAGFSFDKKGSEGSLKYFLFGATASAVMLYGFSLLYGFSGTLDFSSEVFFRSMVDERSPLAVAAAFMVLSGFLFKITAAPMHPWAPDVYEGAPVPVIAFFSVAPKLAGLGILIKFILAIHLFGQSPYDWQAVLAVISILTITVGNFSALLQSNAKRMMAYSSIAHSGFLLAGIAAFLPQGIHFMLFYAAIYMFMNFLVFHYIDFFESRGILSIKSYAGQGRLYAGPLVLMLVGLIALTGLPPTAGFTAKLLVFTALWESYQISVKPILLWLLVFGLLNTVVSLFYYLRIPYYAFLGKREPARPGHLPPQLRRNGDRLSTRAALIHFFGLILVLLVLGLFFIPQLLMGWINKINFV